MDSYARFHPLFIHPCMAAHRARRFVPTPRAPHTQALTSGPRSCSSVGTGQRNGGAVALKRSAPHIPYARHSISSRVVVMITLGPVTSTEQ
jgi:hypothetical protein